MLLTLVHQGCQYSHDDRGPRLEADVSRYRRVGDGMALILVGWSGFRFERLRRSVVVQTGVFPGEPLGVPGPAGPPGSPV